MAAAVPPHRVTLVPAHDARDYETFASLAPGVRNWLVHALTQTWAFIVPLQTSLITNRAYGQGTWQPAPQSHDTIPLASGNSGIVHVWVCVDANNNIVDRVVVKQSVPGVHYYNDPENWANKQVGGEPLESLIACSVHAQLLGNNAGDEKFVAECLGYGDVQHQPPNLWQYKLYYEYMLGDLPGCIKAQWQTTKLVKPSGKAKRKRVVQEQRPFPEEFLWALFESLSKTAVAMDAEGIVHGDLQSANIFFGPPDPNHFAIWPVAKLGDFGSARVADVHGEVDRARMGPWAVPFSAPEMNFDEHPWPGAHTVQFFNHWDPTIPPAGGYVQKPAALTTRTNVWQIGVLMLCAIRLEPELLETQWRDPPPGYSVPAHQIMAFVPPHASRPMKLRLDDDQSRRYSRQLLALVNKCLAMDPEARISPQNLLREVQLKMVGRDGGMAAATGKFPWNHPQAIRMSLNDKYKIGKKPYRPSRVK